jgi:hypothetical protein
MIFIPEVTTILQDMLRDDKGDARDVAARLFSELWTSGESVLEQYTKAKSAVELHQEVFTTGTFSVVEDLFRNGNDETMMFALKLDADLTKLSKNGLWFVTCNYVLS